jgi:hypothetical protein
MRKALLAPGVAHAETPPECASAQQVGSTVHGKFADFHVTVAVTTDDGGDHGKVVGALHDREVWSNAAATVDRCTRASGRVALGEDGWSACTSRRR